MSLLLPTLDYCHAERRGSENLRNVTASHSRTCESKPLLIPWLHPVKPVTRDIQKSRNISSPPPPL